MATEEIFKLPRSSYDELAKIIQAYGSTNKEASIDEIATVVAANRTVVSGNNGFLLAMGIVEGGNKKIITEKGKVLARALRHNIPDEISTHWRTLILDNEFLQKILSAIRIRNGMEVSTLQAHIAYSAGQPKNNLTATGAMAVISIFKVAGLLVEDDGKVLPTAQATLPMEQGSIKPETADDTQLILQKQPNTTRIISAQPGGVSFSVNIQIQCSVDDIETLGSKIRKLMSDIAETTK